MRSVQGCAIPPGHALGLDYCAHFTDEEAEARRSSSRCERMQGGQQGGGTLSPCAAHSHAVTGSPVGPPASAPHARHLTAPASAPTPGPAAPARAGKQEAHPASKRSSVFINFSLCVSGIICNKV